MGEIAKARFEPIVAKKLLKRLVEVEGNWSDVKADLNAKVFGGEKGKGTARNKRTREKVTREQAAAANNFELTALGEYPLLDSARPNSLAELIDDRLVKTRRHIFVGWQRTRSAAFCRR